MASSRGAARRPDSSRESGSPHTSDEQVLSQFVRLRDGDADGAASRGFDAWLVAGPDHARAWAELETLSSNLDHLSPLKTFEAVTSSRLTETGRA